MNTHFAYTCNFNQAFNLVHGSEGGGSRCYCLKSNVKSESSFFPGQKNVVVTKNYIVTSSFSKQIIRYKIFKPYFGYGYSFNFLEIGQHLSLLLQSFSSSPSCDTSTHTYTQHLFLSLLIFFFMCSIDDGKRTTMQFY